MFPICVELILFLVRDFFVISFFRFDKNMTWVGSLQFPEDVAYLVENIIPRLNKNSTIVQWEECLYGLKKFKKHYIWNDEISSNSQLYPSSRWTIVHHAAYFKAPLQVLQLMNVNQYPLSLPDADGKLPVDHLDSSSSKDAKTLLTPTYKINFLQLEMKLLQANFHEVIRERVATLIQKQNLILPVLSMLLEDISRDKEIYFDIPGMYGGFTYWFEFDSTKTEIVALYSRSSSRLVGNSEQLHKCTTERWELVEK